MTTTHTASGPIGSATLTEFIAGLRGTALLPGDADYDQRAQHLERRPRPPSGADRSGARAWPT